MFLSCVLLLVICLVFSLFDEFIKKLEKFSNVSGKQLNVSTSIDLLTILILLSCNILLIISIKSLSLTLPSSPRITPSYSLLLLVSLPDKLYEKKPNGFRVIVKIFVVDLYSK